MKEKGNKKNDLIGSSCTLLVVTLMFIYCAFVFMPEVLKQETFANSNPIEINSEWNELSSYPNRIATYIWFIKVAETTDRVENHISYDDFKEKFNNNEIVCVKYVVKYREVVFYGDEEISSTETKLWRAIATPEQKINGSSFSNPTTSANSIIYDEYSHGIFWMKFIFGMITVVLFAIIIYMSHNIKKIVKNKDYEDKEESDKKEN